MFIMKYNINIIFFIIFIFGTFFFDDAIIIEYQNKKILKAFDGEFIEILKFNENYNNKIITNVRQLKWLKKYRDRFSLCYPSEFECINNIIKNNHEVVLIYTNEESLKIIDYFAKNNNLIIKESYKNTKYISFLIINKE